MRDANGPRRIQIVGGWLENVDAGPTDVVIDRIAAAQNAVASRTQLLAAGIAPSAIDRRRRTKRLRSLHCAVYKVGPDVEVELADETGALLAAGFDALLCDHSAMTLFRMRPGEARPVHVLIPGQRSGPRLQQLVVHRARNLTPDDVTTHRGLPVTTPARAILDTASRLGVRGTQLVIAEAFYLRICSEQDLRDQLARAAGHPGRGTLRQVIDQGLDDLSATDTGDEERLLQMIIAAGLPRPLTQHWVGNVRLDFYWPELGLALEADTYSSHGSRYRFNRDRTRDAELLAQRGIITLRVTRDQLRDEPLKVLAIVAQAIARATMTPGRGA